MLFPILFCNKCCIRGPRAPNKCGGKPRDSSNACRRPTSLSSLSLSAFAADVPDGLLDEWTTVRVPAYCERFYFDDTNFKKFSHADTYVLTLQRRKNFRTGSYAMGAWRVEGRLNSKKWLCSLYLRRQMN